MKITDMNRREFLISGSTGLAAVALGIPSSVQALAATTAAAIAIGYVPETRGRHRGVRIEVPDEPSVISAKAILQPDPAFLRLDARIRILGLQKPASAPFTLSVHYRIDDGRIVPFHAWSTGSPPIRFTAPAEVDHGILLSVESATGTQRTARLALVTGGDTPKLRRGTYFLAPTEDSEPRWSSYQYVPVASEGRRLLCRQTLDGYEPVPFDCLIVNIDYAKLG